MPIHAEDNKQTLLRGQPVNLPYQKQVYNLSCCYVLPHLPCLRQMFSTINHHRFYHGEQTGEREAHLVE